MSITTTFRVGGMTCDHCLAAVESGVASIPGVSAAHADLASGRLDVVSDEAVDPETVRAAVREAGYEVGS